MSTVEQTDGDVIIRGALSVTGSVNIPAASIRNADISPTAAIAASKIVRHQSIDVQIFGSTETIVDNTRLLHIMQGATGTLRKIQACCVTPTTGSDRTVTVDLRKNNAGDDASMMSTKPTLGSTSSPYVPETGVFSATDVVVGDVLYLVTTVAGSSGIQAKGLLVTLALEEDYI